MKRLGSLGRTIIVLTFLFWGMGLAGLADEVAQEDAGPSLKPPMTTPDTTPIETSTEEESSVLPQEMSVEKSEALMTPMSKEIELMQQIEPGFVPKDDRAVQLFMLQQVVQTNEEILKNKKAQIEETRTLFSQQFTDRVNNFANEKGEDFGRRQHEATLDLVKHYEEALKHHAGHPQFAADALYNLGFYYYELDERAYFEKLSYYEEARKEGRTDVPYPDEDFSRTITIYEQLIKEHPNYRYLDSVYYLLALALWYEGAFDMAVEYFQDLIKKFPKSRYVDEVWFRLGEYFYDMLQYDNAIDAYAKVLKNRNSPLYDKAVYKTAWSYFQKDRYDRAIEEFIKVAELSELEKDEVSTTRAEALRYIIKSFKEKQFLEEEKPRLSPHKIPKVAPKTSGMSQSKKVMTDDERDSAERSGKKLAKRVIEYFELRGKPRFYREILVEMASQLLDEQKTQGAILAFEHIQKLDPRHKDNPRIESQIVDILQDAGKLEEARAANLNLIKRYNKQSDWYKAMAKDLEAQANAREAVRDAMLALAVHYHKAGKAYKEAKNEKLADDNFRQAAALYLAYVREYPEREDTPKAIFYFAESSFELNRYRTALEAYQLLKDYPLPMPDNIRRDATFNIVFTFRYVLEQEAKEGRFKQIDFDALTSKYRGEKPETIPSIGQQYLSSIDEFLRIAPKDPQVPVLLFHAAAIYYVYGHHQEAESRFFYIIDTYPETAAAVVSARLILDDAIAQGNWTRVAELSKRFGKQNLGNQKGDFTRIEGNARFKIARAMFEDANELQKKGQLAEAKIKYQESAKLFGELLAEDPKNPNADIMLWNSARAVMQTGTLTEALPLFRRLYTSYPESEFAKTARFQEALALEKMLKFAEAARAYDGIIKADPRSDAAADAMLNKALLFEAAGEDTNAIAAFSTFAKEYPNRPEAPDALLTAAGIYKKQGNTNQQIAMLERFIKQYQKDKTKLPAVIEAHVHIAQSYGDLANATSVPAQKQRYHKLETEHYRSARALYSSELDSPLAAFYAAQAQLFLEKPEQESFRKMSINAKLGKEQGEQLTAMMKKLAELSSKNEAVIKNFAQPVWNAEAMYRIGALYEHLAQAMLKAPCPRDVAAIDELACDEYIVLLEDKATVLEDKALDAYKQSYEIGMSAYDAPASMIDAIQKALNRLRPGKYQRVGNVIEKPKSGAFYGGGRMLSTGRMASGLHGEEIDPDVKKPEPKILEPEPKAPEETPAKVPAVKEEAPLKNNEEGSSNE